MPHETYGLAEITAPAKEPVTLTEAKDHLRVDISDDDTLIGALITAARERAEVFTRRQFITATWDVTWDGFPGGRWSDFLSGSTGIIYTPKPPLQSVASINYIDTGGTSTLLAASDYIVDTASIQGRITPSTDTVWPTTELGRINSLTVRIVAGFGVDESDVPATIRSAILLLVADMYEHREAQSEIKLEDNVTVTQLLWSQRMIQAN